MTSSLGLNCLSGAAVLLHRQPLRLGAQALHLEVPQHGRGVGLVRMLLAGARAAAAQCARDRRRGRTRCGSSSAPWRRPPAASPIRLARCRGRSRSSRPRRGKLNAVPPEYSHRQRAAAVLHREDVRQRAGRVARRGITATVVSPSVILVPSVRRRCRASARRRASRRVALQRRVPIRRAHHDLGAVPALEQRRALIVIAVRVADQHVFDACADRDRASSGPRRSRARSRSRTACR